MSAQEAVIQMRLVVRFVVIRTITKFVKNFLGLTEVVFLGLVDAIVKILVKLIVESIRASAALERCHNMILLNGAVKPPIVPGQEALVSAQKLRV